MLFAHDPEVLVVGAGPVGLMSALSLAVRGVRVEVIDEEQSTQRHNYAVQLHPSVLQLLDDAGIAAELIAQGRRIDSVELYDEQGPRARVRLDRLDTEFPFVLALSRNALEAALEKLLHSRKVPIRWWHRLSDLAPGPADAGVSVEIEKMGVDPGGYSVSAPMYVIEQVKKERPQIVIGADGFHSAVRRRAGIEVEPIGPPLSFAPIEFTTDIDLGGAVRVMLASDATSVLWPLPGNTCRFVFQLHEELPADSPMVHVGQRLYPQAPRALMEGLIRERAPWFKGRIEEVRWAAQVRFEPALARSFGGGRVWLAGDAAHVAGPVGVQSLNAGMHEAHDLGSRVARVLHAGAPWELLSRYGEERTAQWRQLLGLSAGLAPSAATDPWVARNASRLLGCLPATGEHLAQLASQLGLGFEPSPSRRVL